MAINAWWVPEPEQRFWMEATDRKDLGNALRAPTGGTEDQPVWNYDLVSFTKPNDVVFHWHTSLVGRPAIVGWSVVVGPLDHGDYEWTPKGGSNKSATLPPRPHWVMPLGGLHLLDDPITIDDLTAIRSEVLGVRTALEDRITGSSYFPFNKYGDDHLRAMQGYFTKFPAELVEVLSAHYDLELQDAEGVADPEQPSAAPSTPKPGGQGPMADTARRLLLERYSVDRAKAFYAGLGATDIVEVGKPYDLRMQLDGHEVRVEVKGSGSIAGTVIVTRNEVAHAREFARVELFVVDGILVDWDNGVMVATGGRSRRWPAWRPSADSLAARDYDHTLGTDWMDID